MAAPSISKENVNKFIVAVSKKQASPNIFIIFLKQSSINYNRMNDFMK